MNENGDIVDGSIGNPHRVALQERIAELQLEHHDLHSAIERLQELAAPNELQLRRLKRRKLLLKDQIATLERQLDPDEMA